jgi:hypothetical protein
MEPGFSSFDSFDLDPSSVCGLDLAHEVNNQSLLPK